MSTQNSKSQKSKLTPMMAQYFEIKENYQDAIVFFRLGDFYEMFYDDAIVSSKILDITLTTRDKNSDNPVPLCGVPHHALENYLTKLINQGKKVVICDQVEDAKASKGIVKRAVTRVVTPGTITENSCLKGHENNFILSVFLHQNLYHLALCDITTGKFEYFTLNSKDEFFDEILKSDIKEIVYPESLRNHPDIANLKTSFENLFHAVTSDLFFDDDFALDTLKTYFSQDVDNHITDKNIIKALGGMLCYLQDGKLLTQNLIELPKQKQLSDTMSLDASTITQLEIFKTSLENKRHGSLLWHLDTCETVIGSRLLSDWLRTPLIKIEDIKKRQMAVEEFFSNGILSNTLKMQLQKISDLERLANRFVMNKAHPKDAVALRESFLALKEIKSTLKNTTSPTLKNITLQIEEFSDLNDQIANTIVDEPPTHTKNGGYIKDGIHKELDELRHIEKNGKTVIIELEQKERERTGIPTVKIKYNNVFGYFLEVTKAQAHKVPDHYIRKQTLSNAERFITDELKKLEAQVLGATERLKIIENEIFNDLVATIVESAQEIKKSSFAIGQIDVFLSFAEVAKKYGYTQPILEDSLSLNLKDAKHPILERLHFEERFIPNDISLNPQTCSMMLITGPNMAGKSTVMRMTALIVIMAQIGAFVPAKEATIGICDQIFTRIGAHDHLQKGLSTFMVEMVETAKILNQATAKSLVLLDEIGRGTSTFDGLSIAWAVAENLHDQVHARTLFATHYHELCELSDKKQAIKNFHVAVKENQGDIVFLRKLRAGATNKSYGVLVAKMAGLPKQTISKAKDILNALESKSISLNSAKEDTSQIDLFSANAQSSEQDALPVIQRQSLVEQELKEIDTNQMTPLEALNLVSKWQKEV